MIWEPVDWIDWVAMIICIVGACTIIGMVIYALFHKKGG